MSLGVAIKGPEGVVLAADSRVTLGAQHRDGPRFVVNFDNATKLLTFSGKENKYVGAVTYGVAVIGLRTAHSYIPEFEVDLSKEKNKRLTVLEFSQKLSDFFLKRWKEEMPKDYQGPSMTFLIGGFDHGVAYGKVFLVDIPKHPKPEQRNPGENDFGMTWGGQLQIVSRLIHGYDPDLPDIIRSKFNLNNEQLKEFIDTLTKRTEFKIPYPVLPLQDCVNLAIFLIRTTMSGQELAVGVRGVGGMIDVATITRTKGLRIVQRKEIHGELRSIQMEGAI